MACKVFLDFYNGQKMPALGFGTWRAKDAECEVAVEEALKAGYRHIDTAFAYDNEKIVGKVINKWISEGKIKREDIFLTTKLHAACLYPDKIEEYMKTSLENLGMDYVDLYLVHFPCSFNHEKFVTERKFEPDFATDLMACWKKMEEQVDAKRTKSIGLSNFKISQIQRILDVARIKPANLQVELHLYMQQRDLVNFCKKNNITVVAYCPLGNPGFNDFLSSLGKEKRDLPNVLGNETVKRVAEKHNKTPAQVALRYAIQRGISAIPKSSNPGRIKENINIFDFTLDSDDISALDALEVGPSARICDFGIFEGISNHPEFPF